MVVVVGAAVVPVVDRLHRRINLLQEVEVDLLLPLTVVLPLVRRSPYGRAGPTATSVSSGESIRRTSATCPGHRSIG